MPDPSSSMSPPPRYKTHRTLLRPAAVVLLLAGAGLACSLTRGSSPSTRTSANGGAGSLNNPSAGLEGLSSYRATLHLEFDGTQNGAPLTWSQDLRLESDQTATARLLSIDRRGPDASQDVEGTLIGQFGSMTITRPATEGACQGQAGETPLAIPEPASLLRPLQQSITYSGSPEERNGVSTLHGALDSDVVEASPQAKVQGEIWVAKEGGYIVRYVLEINGTEDDWGKGIEGVMRWEYDIDGVGQDLGLLPPPGCPPGMVDAPLPDDAAKVETQPGILTLTTGLDVTAAAEFYREQLPLHGWSESNTGFLTPRAAWLTFLQPSQQLVISIRDGPPTQIWITLEYPATPAPTTSAAATPGINNAVDPMKRVAACLSTLLFGNGQTPALPSYHLEVNHFVPVWAGGKLDRTQEVLSADVQGKDVHFTDRTTAPTGPASTVEAYMINGTEYVVRDGMVTPGQGMTALTWTTWQMDPTIIISVGSQGTTPAGIESLDGRTAERYNLDGSGTLGAGTFGGIGLPGTQATATRGSVWVDQETGALLKAVLDYDADVKDDSGGARGSGSGHLEIAVTQVGLVTVTLPGR
jgi:hypothetical protein